LKSVNALAGLTNLTYLSLSGCDSLENVDALDGLSIDRIILPEIGKYSTPRLHNK